VSLFFFFFVFCAECGVDSEAHSLALSQASQGNGARFAARRVCILSSDISLLSIAPLKKDVTAKLYGGDVTRKASSFSAFQRARKI
jgi:hypothetical protein